MLSQISNNARRRCCYMSTPEPILPEAQPVTVITEKSALLVLDLSQLCADPKETCHKLVPGITRFLDRTRAAGIPAIFTISDYLKGKPNGQVYSGFKRTPSEAVIFPDGFDKFGSGELQRLLSPYNVDTLIITGYRSNIAVLYTATAAAREFKYNVVIPIDGLVALTDYEQQYTLFQFTVLPGEAARRFTFTTLDMISFQSAA